VSASAVARIIPFRRDVHHEAQLLLPWYVSGRLDAADRERVEAHLAVCPECAAELDQEREFAAEVAAPPADADRGWARMRDRLEGHAAHRERSAARRRRRLGVWSAVAATVCAIALLSVTTFRTLQAPSYRTLAAPPEPVTPSLVVMFRPDTREEDLRRILVEADARLVDGPTEAGAYVLHTPPDKQAAALAGLRRRPQVVMAQPVDGPAQP
jgi:hypothetical protein